MNETLFLFWVGALWQLLSLIYLLTLAESSSVPGRKLLRSSHLWDDYLCLLCICPVTAFNIVQWAASSTA